MLILNSPEIAQATLLRWKSESRIAFVPTMGCLHEGHLSLVRMARQLGSRVVVSIFVNPLQFGPQEDLTKYPRPFDADRTLLEAEGVDLLFAPATQELYPQDFQTFIVTGRLARHLCGSHRPGHFDGVATVCLKLFEIVSPDIAVFGEKDFQQLMIIKQLVADFNLPMRIEAHPIVREADGLALSSRNRYLSPQERNIATTLFLALSGARELPKDSSSGQIVTNIRNRLADFTVEYIAICGEDDLCPIEGEAPITEIIRPRLFAAVKLGATRLIDNVPLYSI